jgi:hypothetical protein
MDGSQHEPRRPGTIAPAARGFQGREQVLDLTKSCESVSELFESFQFRLGGRGGQHEEAENILSIVEKNFREADDSFWTLVAQSCSALLLSKKGRFALLVI